MSETSIEWTDVTWNPVRGCALVSPGCTNCYAMKTAFRFNGEGMAYEALTRDRKNNGPVWTGDARFVPAKLAEPIRWRKQARADERIPLLLQMPAAVRFLSVEPLLENIDLNVAAWGEGEERPPLEIQARQIAPPGTQPWRDGFAPLRAIDWVIVGGETGPNARPCDIAWLASVRDQCATAGVPCFVKQWGSAPAANCETLEWMGLESGVRLRSRKGADLAELPGGAAAWPREFPRLVATELQPTGNRTSTGGAP